jgi:hypothetical protein
MSHVTISFYVVVSLAWAIGFMLMALLIHPAVASPLSACPICMSRLEFLALFIMGAVGGASVGFVGGRGGRDD